MRAAVAILRTTAVTPLAHSTTLHRRTLHSKQVPAQASWKSRTAVEDTGRIIDGGCVGTKGRTGGGEELNSTAAGAPRKPKLSNFSTPGVEDRKNLTKEQKEEVDEHNRLFDEMDGRKEDMQSQNRVDEKFEDGQKATKEDGSKGSKRS